MSTLTVSLWALALTALGACVVSDLYKRIIPNEMVILVAVLGLAIGLSSRPGQVWISVAAAFMLLIALGLLAHSNLIGGGDAKLIAAATLLVSPDHIGVLLIEMSCAGGLLSCAYLTGGLLLRGFDRWQATEDAPVNEPVTWFAAERARIASLQSVPYGIAISASVFFFFLSEFSR